MPSRPNEAISSAVRFAVSHPASYRKTVRSFLSFVLGTALAMSFAVDFNLAAADPTADELAKAIQKKYDAVPAFETDFVHTYRGGVLKTQLTERGHLLVKKPGRMRWEYTSPEKKLFVSDGFKVYFYIPDDKRVIVSNAPRDDRPASPALFLAGKGNLVRDFTPSVVEPPAGSAPGSRALKLVPKTAQPDYDWLTLVVDPATLGLRGLAYGDPQGGMSTFSFEHLKENPGMSDKAFDFRPPRGVDVVSERPAH
jgi:outer membrane lipoprotein carrier protein